MTNKVDKKSSAHILKNVGQVLRLVWGIDRRVFILTVTFSLLGAIFPIILSYVYRLVLDELIRITTTAGIITVTLLSLFGFRYFLDLLNDLQKFYHYQYLDFIFKYKMENALTFNFAKKMSELDMPHF